MSGPRSDDQKSEKRKTKYPTGTGATRITVQGFRRAERKHAKPLIRPKTTRDDCGGTLSLTSAWAEIARTDPTNRLAIAILFIFSLPASETLCVKFVEPRGDYILETDYILDMLRI